MNKVKLMAQLLVARPVEFWDRASMAVERRLERQKSPHRAILANSLSTPSDAFRSTLEGYFAEDALKQTEAHIVEGLGRLASSAPFGMAHSADFCLARFCYAVCRATKPRVVVETGVAYGVTTCHILMALEENGTGELWSIDLPPLTSHSEDYQGILVSSTLRKRWHLCCGTSRRILPGLLKQLPGVDVFVHDSLHTYRNMAREFKTIWPVLKSMLISDDIDQNSAFRDFALTVRPSISFAVREDTKDSIFGVVLKSQKFFDSQIC